MFGFIQGFHVWRHVWLHSGLHVWLHSGPSYLASFRPSCLASCLASFRPSCLASFRAFMFGVMFGFIQLSCLASVYPTPPFSAATCSCITLLSMSLVHLFALHVIGASFCPPCHWCIFLLSMSLVHLATLYVTCQPSHSLYRCPAPL